MDAKRTEGEAAMKEGKKLSSKTLFRWKPDWDHASIAFDKAGLCFKNAKEFEKALEAYTLSGEAHEKCHLFWASGKAYENAAMIAKQLGKRDESLDLFKRAAMRFREDGKPDRAGDMFTRAAKMMEPSDVDVASSLYHDAISTYIDDEKEHLSGETFKALTILLLRNQKYEEAAAIFAEQIPVFLKLDQFHNVGKNLLSQVVIFLHAGNIDRAQDLIRDATLNEEFNTHERSFVTSEEKDVADQLLASFEEQDEERLEETKRRQAFEFLEHEVTRLARGLKLTGGVPRPKKEPGDEDAEPDVFDEENLL